MLAFLTCQNKLTCDRHICTNKSATIYGIVNDPLIYSIPSSKTIYFVISFNATCFHRKRSSSGVLYRTLKIKVIWHYFLDLSNTAGHLLQQKC